MIALIDYRAGNLASVRKAFAAVGAELYTPLTPDDLRHARAIVVPGVGHFGATAVLDAGWRDAIRASLDRGMPLLGICLGLQWLFAGSEEAPDLPGLGVLEGRCRLLDPARADGPHEPLVAAGATSDSERQESPLGRGSAREMKTEAERSCESQDPEARSRPRIKVPHVGWNALEQLRPSALLGGVPDRAQAYFTHSYVAPVTGACVATTTHGERFASVVERSVVYGAQFHPEKSGEVGLQMLRNFLVAVSTRG